MTTPADVIAARRCEGRVVIVTGAGRGLGRAHALELARQGAIVVVNDLGVGASGESEAASPADEVVKAIEALGGTAVADSSDVSDWDSARSLVGSTVDRFGRLDGVVNNAGILRDRTVAKMDIEEWDAVIRVHLRSTFCMTRWAVDHWRTRSESESRESIGGRIVNTASGAGLYGNYGQANYGAAKAGIASFTTIAAMETERFGVTVNAISPAAHTRMTENLLSPERAAELAPERVAPLVAWLISGASSGITGKIFNVSGNVISVANGWYAGPSMHAEDGWSPEALDDVVPTLVSNSVPRANLQGVVEDPRSTVGAGKD